MPMPKQPVNTWNADEPVTPTSRRLRIGDFYVRDGSIHLRKLVEGSRFTFASGKG